MKEEHLKDIEITNIEYCLDPILGKYTYTLNQLRK